MKKRASWLVVAIVLCATAAAGQLFSPRGGLAQLWPFPLAGLSTTTQTDPVVDYFCSGSRNTTTGTISTGTTSLTIVSALGWTTGMGIAVKNAGSGGITELISTIDAISGTTFTLHNAAAATATGQTVSHDDTVCLQSAINSGKNVRLHQGNYNITSTLSFAAPVQFECEGAVSHVGTSDVSTVFTQGTVIWNRTTNQDMLNVTQSYVTIDNCGLNQDPAITPTTGFAIVLGSVTPYIQYDRITNNVVGKTAGSLAITGNVLLAVIAKNYFYSLGNTANGVVLMNNPAPAGDIHWEGNTIQPFTNGRGLVITQADTQHFYGNKFSGASPAVLTTPGGGQHVYNLTFVANSFEGWPGIETQPLISLTGDTNLINFVGNEFGGDNAAGGFAISGTGGPYSIVGNTFNAAFTGTGFANSGTGKATLLGNVSVNADATLTDQVNLPTSAGAGGLFVCVDTAGKEYKKATCP